MYQYGSMFVPKSEVKDIEKQPDSGSHDSRVTSPLNFWNALRLMI